MYKRLNYIITFLLLASFCLNFNFKLHAQAPFQNVFNTPSTNKTVRSFNTNTNTTNQPDLSALQNQINAQQLLAGQEGGLTYNVHVLGEVLKPGSYSISPSDRLSQAIERAGGIQENGSMRNIEIRRKTRTTRFDLFKYQVMGSLEDNPYLMENDVIFVPLKSGEFQVEGPVKRPGKYELKEQSLSLARALKIAGGYTSGLAKKDSIRIIRFNSEEKKQIIEINPKNQKEVNSFRILSGDIVVVPHLLIADNKFDYNVSRIPGDNIFYPTINDNVYVIGSVTVPGPYTFQPTLKYRDYISLAGPTNGSNLKRVKVLSFDGKKYKAKKVDKINPGDTIIVPSKNFTFKTVLGWFNTLTGTTLTSLLLYDRLKEDN